MFLESWVNRLVRPFFRLCEGARILNGGLLTTITHRAMATEFAVILPRSAAADADAVLHALEQLDELENRLTVYQESSEISKVNRDASKSPVRVSKSTFELLEKAVNWSKYTGGAFDITAGPLVHAWGFMTRSGRKPSAQEVEEALTNVGFSKLVLDGKSDSVAFSCDSMSINLGAIGKGFALDCLASELTKNAVKNFLLHGGQSSVVAVGDQSPGSGNGWAVGLAHPTKPKRRIGGLWLKDQALATSGSGKQFFHHQGKRYGHVIDPRTGYPAGDLLSLTLICDSATDADALATGLFVTGSEEIIRLYEDVDRPWQAAVLVRPNERQDDVGIESLGEISWVQD